MKLKQKKDRLEKLINIQITAFNKACERLSFLDDINSTLSFSDHFLNKYKDNMMLLSDNYNVSMRVLELHNSDIYIIKLAYGLLKLRHPTDNDYDEMRGYNMYKNANNEYEIESPMNIAAITKSMIYDLVSILNFNKGIHELYSNAMKGSNKDLLHLVQIDKTCLYSEWFKSIVLKKQYEADWYFFKKLSASMGKFPFNEKKSIPKAIILSALFWEQHFVKTSYKNITRFLVMNDVLPKSTDYDTFRRSLNRVGLKKERYNKKAGQ
ncbi:MAG: hypothetical protein JXI43_06470 [Tissierellales bacterium]|nr:hypothetical protein [Tissierellales bacterium]